MPVATFARFAGPPAVDDAWMTYEVGGSPAFGTNQKISTCEPVMIGRNRNDKDGTAGSTTVTNASFEGELMPPEDDTADTRT